MKQFASEMDILKTVAVKQSKHKKNQDSMENLLANTKGSKKSSSLEGDKPTSSEMTLLDKRRK